MHNQQHGCSLEVVRANSSLNNWDLYPESQLVRWSMEVERRQYLFSNFLQEVHKTE